MSPSYIHSSAIVEDGAILMNGSKVWHFCHVRSGAILEEGVVLGKDVYVDADVRIGKNSRVQNGVSIYKGVTIAPWCFIGPHVIFTNDISPRAGNRNWIILPTHLRTGMSIGAGAIIRCGVTLGEFCMIGAGAMVTKDVPHFHLAVGLPAKVEKMVCACGMTFLPLRSSSVDLIRICCEENLDSEALLYAKKFLNI
jgi:UDP-2-acetamido-3-amino-2,3-dideoxy-glucuronate N-acetyltransferase